MASLNGFPVPPAHDFILERICTHKSLYENISIQEFIKNQLQDSNDVIFKEKRARARIKAPKLLEVIIKYFESCKLVAYKDESSGIWTCGWGATGYSIKKGVVWSQPQADRVLKLLMEEAYMQALISSPILKSATTGRQIAITDFIYNTGPEKYEHSTLKVYVDKGEWVLAQKEILRWHHADKKDVKGLQKRRKLESELIGGQTPILLAKY